MDFYPQIFKRKSFHLFRGAQKLSAEELQALRGFWEALTPLDPEIKTEIQIVPESVTTCRRGAEYCILFYSEPKGDYLRNIGYIGEQIDLYLASQNIGALWFGMGKPPEARLNGLDYVIMIAIAKMPEDKFRADMFKAKRKPLDEIWRGDTLGVAEIVRFAPSACNSQPWITEQAGTELRVYRWKKPGKRGVMPIRLVSFYNRIDVGIFLFFLEICLRHEGYTFRRTLLPDNQERETTHVATYAGVIKTAEQIARIEAYEADMNEARRLLAAPPSSESSGALVEKMARLEAYYGSDDWKQDFADDEAGRLPKDLRRGVLSEDGIYNLLEQFRAWENELR